MEFKQGFPHVVRINWCSKSQDVVWWNDVCQLVLNVFGTPGIRFLYNPFEDYMEFLFKSEKDAIICKLLLSDKL